MTPRVHATLAPRWDAQGKPAQGWGWPSDTETKTGHIDHSTMKKQHRKALISKVTPFVLYSLRHTFLTRLGAVQMSGRSCG